MLTCPGRALLHQRRDIAMPKHKDHKKSKHSKASKRKRESSTSCSSAETSSVSSRERQDVKALRRGVPICKLPFIRLQGMLAKAEERFDHAWTAGMEVDKLCMLLWVATKLRPDLTTGKLGVKS